MTIRTARILRVNGNDEGIEPEDGPYLSNEQMQEVVGGSIEIVGLYDGRLMILLEDGKLQGAPWNRQATELFNAGGRMWFDPIAGDVIVCDEGMLRMDEIDDEEPDGDTYFDV